MSSSLLLGSCRIQCQYQRTISGPTNRCKPLDRSQHFHFYLKLEQHPRRSQLLHRIGISSRQRMDSIRSHSRSFGTQAFDFRRTRNPGTFRLHSHLQLIKFQVQRDAIEPCSRRHQDKNLQCPLYHAASNQSRGNYDLWLHCTSHP